MLLGACFCLDWRIRLEDMTEQELVAEAPLPPELQDVLDCLRSGQDQGKDKVLEAGLQIHSRLLAQSPIFPVC